MDGIVNLIIIWGDSCRRQLIAVGIDCLVELIQVGGDQFVECIVVRSHTVNVYHVFESDAMLRSISPLSNESYDDMHYVSFNQDECQNFGSAMS